MRVSLDGGQPELVAWGFRNPFGLHWYNNQLYVTDNAFDDRGSRPLWAAPDLLWRVETGKWYGWPDYVGDFSVQPAQRLLARLPNDPPKPLARFGCHSSAVGLAFAPTGSFGFAGQVFVAQFGDQAPDVGKIYDHVGYKVVRVDPATGVITDFAVNKGRKNAPASEHNSGGLERPIDVKFAPDGTMYVVDFGRMPITEDGPAPKKETGVIWKITKQ
jgi:glucose/arabinose dehydrogenase